VRLDLNLVERGLARSRNHAQQLIAAGLVRVDGAIAAKPATPVSAASRIEVEADPYVSRAAGKLLGALADSGTVVPPRVLDAGASTGGFTQVVLAAGAQRVYAVDVGHDQIAATLRADPRVVVRERINLRDLTLEHLDGLPVGLVVADVSFISLRLLLAPMLAVLDAAGEALLLVKPQFEVGRAGLDRHGVVRDPRLRERAVADVAADAASLGWKARWTGESRVPGTSGNVEYFVRLAKPRTSVVSGPRAIEGWRAPTDTVVRVNEPRRRVAVTMHPKRPAASHAAAEFIDGMTKRGIVCLVGADDLPTMEARVPGAAVEELTNTSTCELSVVFGGDGNILRAAEWALPRQVPVLGVNLGHVGFLAELESAQVDTLVDTVVERAYQVEERLTVDCELRACAGGEVIWRSFAVNECSLEKRSRQRMVEVLVRVDDRPLSRWATDGVLVATPTGSTAYAFSAHGPVIWPDVDALLFVPLSAHALFARPIVLSPLSTVRAEVIPGGPGGVVWCDGRRSVDVDDGQELSVHQGAHRLRLARTSEQPFITRLVRKFALPIDGWRGTDPQERVHAS